MKKLLMILVVGVAILMFAGSALASQNDSVLSSSIAEADGTSGQDTNSGNGIKTGHIQDGAITGTALKRA